MTIFITMARVGAGPLKAPVVSPVPVGVRAFASVAWVSRPRLSPHPVAVPGVLVPVGVHAGHDVHVEGVQKYLVFG